MVLYCRQLAFYGATPEKASKSRLEAIRASHRLIEDSDDSAEDTSPLDEVHFPDIAPGGQHLVGLFVLAGQIHQTAQGIAPLDWTQLKAFTELNDLDLCVWEIRIIKKMSEAYCSEYYAASDPSRPIPYRHVVEETEEDKLAKARRMLKNMSGFKKRKG